ncbi:hypothetical protein CRUP_010251, partial [Coryphaenoides rupestris]
MMQCEAQLSVCRRCLWCYRSGLRLLSLSSAHRVGVNYYELLGVKPGAPLSEIKDAFFNKSKKLHPDCDTSNPALHSQFVELNQAYQVLSRKSSRKEYDFKLRTATPYTGGRASYTAAHNNNTSSTPHKGRKLEEVHSNFMDEKDRTITEIYNQSKERAKVNGVKKQAEILRQKHAEFMEKYHAATRGGGE